MLNNAMQLHAASLPKEPKPCAGRFNDVSQDPSVGRNGFAAMFASLAGRSESAEPQVPSDDESPDDVVVLPGENAESESETGGNEIATDAALSTPPPEADADSEIAGNDSVFLQDKAPFRGPSSGEQREDPPSQTPSEAGTAIGMASDSRMQEAGASRNPTGSSRDVVRSREGPLTTKTSLATGPKATALSDSGVYGETKSTSLPAGEALPTVKPGFAGTELSSRIAEAHKQDGTLPQPALTLPANAAMSEKGRDILNQDTAPQTGLLRAETNLGARETGPQVLAPNAPTDSSRVRDFAPEAPFGTEEPVATFPDRNKTSAGLEGTIKLAPDPGAAAKSFAREPSAFFPELSSEALEISAKDPANTLPFRFETGLGFSATSGLDYGMARADSVRNAAAQAVEVIIRQPGKPVEIALNPEELGRVRMALTTTESGVSVVITSERPETLDLMRRHIDQLAQEFLRLGYENTAFEFGSDSGNGAPAPKGVANAAEAESGFPNADKTLHPNTSRLVTTGLDLRL